MNDELEQAIWRAGRRRDGEIEVGMRRKRGVVHTPPEIARHVVRRVDRVLREQLGVSGLSDDSVRIVDPACGPGAFLAAVLACAGGAPRVQAFDLDGDAIATAKATLGTAFAERGREVEWTVGDTLSFSALIEPSDDVVVVIGNPPWAAKTANRGSIEDLLADFARDADGAPLGERKRGVLSDDYVRFFRFGAEIVRQARAGVLAFATNGSFLDGVVHRGMRAAFLRWFDHVEIVDLGGNALIARRGDRDDNVFGVRPSAALTIAWRGAGAEPRNGSVSYARIRGDRASKLAALDDRIETERLEPTAPFFVFARSGTSASEYRTFVSLAEAMPFHREGVQTNRDEAVIAESRDALRQRLERFVAGDEDPALSPALRRTGHYDPDKARRAVANALECAPDSAMRPIAYRPFRTAYFAPIAPFCHRPRPDLLAAFDHAPLALVTVRKDRGELPWTHFAAVRHVPDNCFLSTRSSCRARAFPLRTPDGDINVSALVVRAITREIDRDVEPATFLHYALAVLANERYRDRYDDCLRLDYPRIPMPKTAEHYDALVDLGRGLADAFFADEDGEHVAIGHHRVRSSRIAGLIRAIDAL